MANSDHVRILEQGVRIWNQWRKENPEIKPDLSGIDIRRGNLNKINLSSTNLREATFFHVGLSGANLTLALLFKANFEGSNLSRANLRGVHAHDVTFTYAKLTGAKLNEGAFVAAKFWNADLTRANLTNADCAYSSFMMANLTEADLTGIEFRQANLLEIVLDGARLTDACLWETQRAGWSIKDIICERVYWGSRDGWDEYRQEPTTYSPGEFERLYADKTKIILRYKGGLNLIEITTLPALIQQIEATHPGSVLRLQAIQEAPGGATVTLVVDDLGGYTPDELKEDMQKRAKQLQAAQRYALEQATLRQDIERQLVQLKERIFPLLIEQATQQPRYVEDRVQYITVLFLDIRGFSSLGSTEQTAKVAMLRGLAQPLFEQGDGRYVNTWGDAIVACFEDTNTGIMCACQLINMVKLIGIHTRIGMSHGKTLVRHNPLTDRLDIEGDRVNFAARLEPLAQAGEVLLSEELRYHPDVDQNRFIFTPQQRPLPKAIGDKSKGTLIECYTVTLAKAEKPGADSE